MSRCPEPGDLSGAEDDALFAVRDLDAALLDLDVARRWAGGRAHAVSRAQRRRVPGTIDDHEWHGGILDDLEEGLPAQEFDPPLAGRVTNRDGAIRVEVHARAVGVVSTAHLPDGGVVVGAQPIDNAHVVEDRRQRDDRDDSQQIAEHGSPRPDCPMVIGDWNLFEFTPKLAELVIGSPVREISLSRRIQIGITLENRPIADPGSAGSPVPLS
jgi:hypothetical protein